MSQCIKYTFAKICIVKIYFTYIFFTKVRYIRQNIFYIYLTYISMTLKYIFVAKSCIFRVYILFPWGENPCHLQIVFFFTIDHLSRRWIECMHLCSKLYIRMCKIYFSVILILRLQFYNEYICIERENFQNFVQK